MVGLARVAHGAISLRAIEIVSNWDERDGKSEVTYVHVYEMLDWLKGIVRKGSRVIWWWLS